MAEQIVVGQRNQAQQGCQRQDWNFQWDQQNDCDSIPARQQVESEKLQQATTTQ